MLTFHYCPRIKCQVIPVQNYQWNVQGFHLQLYLEPACLPAKPAFPSRFVHGLWQVHVCTRELPVLINSLSIHYNLEKQGRWRGRFSFHIVGPTFVFLLLLQPGKQKQHSRMS